MQKIVGNPQNGSICDVVDGASGKTFGWGVYNDISMYRVRILAFDRESEGDERDIEKLVEIRLRSALILRKTGLGIPSERTTAYRLVNGEGDRLSGLAIDVFGDVLGVSSSAFWVETHREKIERAIFTVFDDKFEVVWRQSDGRLQQDGWISPNVLAKKEKAEKEMEEGGEAVEKEELEPVLPEVDNVAVETKPAFEIVENGVRYMVQPRYGQKTGFYCDQRENRALFQSLSKGKKVLDMFCYSGGFAINAAIGGATSVMAVDSSPGAISTGVINAELNGVKDRITFERGDALKWMDAAFARGERYDLIVLDPPKLAPNKKALERATLRYKRLNSAALNLLEPSGGLLLTFTCSAAMTQSGNFLTMVKEAGITASRRVTQLRAVGASSCHPINPAYLEGEYLSGCLVFACK